MKGKLMAIFLVVGITASVLTACKTSSSKTTSQASTAGSKLSGSVVFWSQWNESENEAKVFQTDAIDAFKKANPDVQLTVKWCGRTVNTTALTAIDAGQQVDVIENITHPKNQAYALKLDDYYDKVYPTTGGKKFKDTLIPSALKCVATSSGDTGYYYVPEMPYIQGVFYNKAEFTKAGITAPPKTWSDFLTDCGKLKAKGIIPITVDDAYYSSLMGEYLNQLIGQPAIEKMVSDKTGASWNSAAVTQMAQAFSDLYKNGYISSSAATNKYPAGQQEFALGKVAMYYNGSWFPNEVSATTGPDFKWGCFLFPKVPNATVANTVEVYSCGTVTISKNTKNPDAAFDFATYLIEGKTATDLVSKCQAMPVVQGVSFPKNLADCKAMIDSLTGDGTTVCGAKWPASALKPTQTTDFSKLVSGQMTAEQFNADILKKLKG